MTRISICLSLLLVTLLASCGGGGSSSADDAALELPTAKILGALPPSPGRVDVTINGEGTLRVNGRLCELSDLKARLNDASGRRSRLEEALEEVEEDTEEVSEQEIVTEEPVIKDDEAEGLLDYNDKEVEDDGGPIDFRAADLARNNPKRTVVELPKRDPGPRPIVAVHPQALSPADVLLRIDRRVPMRVVDHVLWACADPEVLLYRLFVAVREAPSDEVGAIAAFLPVDGGLCGGRIVVGTDVRIDMAPRKGAGSRSAVAAVLATRRKLPDDALFVSLYAAPLTRWGDVVGVMVEALRTGTYSFTYGSLLHSKQQRTIAAWIELADKEGPYEATVRGTPVPSHAAARLIDDGRRDGYFGYSNAVTMGDEEIIDDEDVKAEPNPFDK